LTKIAKFLCPTWEGFTVDYAVFGLSMVLSVPEMFANKVWSCPKSRRILDVFCPSKF